MPNIDDFLETPPPELISNLQGIRAERAALERKEAVLEQLIEMITQQGGPAAEEITALGPANGIGPLREQIKDVFRSSSAETLLMVPRDIQAQLAARGNRSVTLDNVRVAMKRMADDDELLRPDPGAVLYGLASTEGTEEALEMFKAVRQAQVEALTAMNGNGQPG